MQLAYNFLDISTYAYFLLCKWTFVWHGIVILKVRYSVLKWALNSFLLCVLKSVWMLYFGKIHQLSIGQFIAQFSHNINFSIGKFVLAFLGSF